MAISLFNYLQKKLQLNPKEIDLQPYNADWKKSFEQLSAYLNKQIANVTIVHIGSTAIEGMMAKPILDLDIIIPSINEIQPITFQLEQLGYLAKGNQGIEGRFAFKQVTTAVPIHATINYWMPHHLYVCVQNSLALQNHLMFKEALTKNETLKKDYINLKCNLIYNQRVSRKQYAMAKTNFIVSVLRNAGMNEDDLEQIRLANIG
ncbi:MAG: GrpB family protein [Chitinophagaceae bacterium]